MKSEIRVSSDGTSERALVGSHSATDDRGFCQVLKWTDPKTLETLAVEVWGTKEFIAELVSTGFEVGGSPAVPGRDPRCFISMEQSARARPGPERAGPTLGPASGAA